MKKIFLSPEQLEKLVFDKILLLNKKQMQIGKAKNGYSFDVLVPEKDLLYQGDDAVILFSAVEKIEFPVSESNLLQNQFKLPAGLLAPLNRKMPKETEIAFNEPVTEQEWRLLYTKIRRGFLQLLLFGFRNPAYREKTKHFFSAIMKEENAIALKLFNAIKKYQSYPFIQMNKIATDEFFRYLWWGKFVSDNLFKKPGATGQAGDNIEWLKKISVTDLKKNIPLFKTVPEVFSPHKALLLGYFFAAVTVCEDCDKSRKLLETLKALRITGQEYDEILFWGIVFDAFFNENTDQVYPNPLVKDGFLQIEKLVLYFSQKIAGAPTLSEEIPLFNYKHFDDDQLFSAFYEFNTGLKNPKRKVLHPEKTFAPFEKSLLFGENRKRIGFINHKIDGSSTLSLYNGLFMFSGHLDRQVPVFYGDLNGETKQKLKKNLKLNIQIKPLHSLLGKDKKVLTCFLPEYSVDNALLSLYRKLINGEKNRTNIQKIVFIRMVSARDKDIHSTDFAMENIRLQNRISHDFGLPAKVLVKAEESPDREIIRNLSIELEGYKVKNIEVLDHNFEPRYARWILEATNDYAVRYAGRDYFTVQ